MVPGTGQDKRQDGRLAGWQIALMLGAAIAALVVALWVIPSFRDRPHHTLKNYPRTPAGDLQWQADLTEEMLAVPCLDPELRASLEASKDIVYHNPELVLDSIAEMEKFLIAYDGVGCP